MNQCKKLIAPGLILSSLFLTACLPEDLPISSLKDIEGTWLLESSELNGYTTRVEGHDYVNDTETAEMVEQQLAAMENFNITGDYREICHIKKLSMTRFETSCFPYLQQSQFFTGISIGGDSSAAPQTIERKVSQMSWDGKVLNSEDGHFQLYFEGDQLIASTSTEELIPDKENNMPLVNHMEINNIYMTRLSTDSIAVISSDIAEDGINSQDSYSHLVELNITMDISFMMAGFTGQEPEFAMPVTMHSFFAYNPNQDKPILSAVIGDYTLISSSEGDCNGEPEGGTCTNMTLSVSSDNQISFNTVDLQSFDKGMPQSFIDNPAYPVEYADLSVLITLNALTHGSEISFSGVDSDLTLSDLPNDDGDVFTGTLNIDYSEYMNP